MTQQHDLVARVIFAFCLLAQASPVSARPAAASSTTTPTQTTRISATSYFAPGVSALPQKVVDVAPTAEDPVPIADTVDSFPVQVKATVSKQRVENQTDVTLTLSLTAITDTQELTLITQLPDGLDADKDSNDAYNSATREIIVKGIAAQKDAPQQRAYHLHVNTRQVPANLPISVTLTSPAGARAEALVLIQIGDNRISAAMTPDKGGRVQVSDRITLDFPPNALRDTTSVTSIAYAPFTVRNDASRIPYLQFSLDPEMTFDEPVIVTTDVRGLFGANMFSETGRLPVLSYLYMETITPTVNELTGEPVTATVLRR